MKARLLVDYRGVLSGERFYRAGDIVDASIVNVSGLVAAGRAEVVEETPPEPAPKPPPKRTTRRRKKSDA